MQPLGFLNIYREWLELGMVSPVHARCTGTWLSRNEGCCFGSRAIIAGGICIVWGPSGSTGLRFHSVMSLRNRYRFFSPGLRGRCAQSEMCLMQTCFLTLGSSEASPSVPLDVPPLCHVSPRDRERSVGRGALHALGTTHCRALTPAGPSLGLFCGF